MVATMTDLEMAIHHLNAMADCIDGLVELLRKIERRPWPEIPNGEGIAGEASAGIVPAESICACGHPESSHQTPVGGMSWCKHCECTSYIPRDPAPGAPAPGAPAPGSPPPGDPPAGAY